MGWLSNLSRGVRLGLAAGVLALAVFAGWYVFVRPQAARQEAATSRVEAISERAQTGAAQDTVRIVVDRQAADVRIIKVTEENTREIMAAPGAGTLVSPELHAAGVRAICLRDNVSDVQCADVLHRAGDGVGAGEGNTPRPTP